jgi:hypothetical protein
MLQKRKILAVKIPNAAVQLSRFAPPKSSSKGIGSFIPYQRLLRIPHHHQKRLLLSRDVDDSDSISKSCNRAFFMELD